MYPDLSERRTSSEVFNGHKPDDKEFLSGLILLKLLASLTGRFYDIPGPELENLHHSCVSRQGGRSSGVCDGLGT